MTKKYIYGFHAIIAKMRHHPESIIEIYIDGNRSDARVNKLIHLANFHQIELKEYPRTRLNNILPEVKHQGVIANITDEVKYYALPDILDTIEEDISLLVLDGVTDPRNLGACLRVADAVGVHAVVVPKDRSAGLSDVAIKTACGAAEHIPFCTVTNLARTLREIAERDIHIIGLADEAEQSIYQATWPKSVAWVLGAEGTGLRQLTRSCCHQLLSIPMLGSVESLNVATATAVCLYESLRRSNSKL